MQATDTDSMCPSCGHLRAGIPGDARCPECGSEGFGDAFVIHGTQVRPILPLIVVACTVPLLVSGFIAMASMVASGRLHASLPVIVAAAVIVLLSGGLWFVLRSQASLRIKTRVPAVWMIHPDGVVVRVGGSSRSIPRSAIKSIRCAESFFGSTSQLVLVHRLFTSFALSATSIIYIHGATESRRARWRNAKRILRLDG